ncbi:MAG TPA: beta-ketoacyl synthase N-terminal-like domain-containing protein [Phycisphaerales bacterium]|nr:beta-ketoacyl synthase N-terminal-like domain-containing protein [Phycisphaerales bacterium]
MRRRVVITGVGAVSGFGVGLPALWAGLVEGRSALRRLGLFDASGFPWRLGAEAAGFSARDHVPKHYRKAVKVMARDTELAVAAAGSAVSDAGLVTRVSAEEGTATTYPGERLGCQIGAGLIAAEVGELAAAFSTAVVAGGGRTNGQEDWGGFDLRAWGTVKEAGGGGGMENLPPLWMLKYLPNMLACHVTILHGAEGPSNTITCSESSGLLSIGESVRVIERDDADACFSGGAESKLNPMGVLRIGLAGRLAETGDAEEGAGFVRPFDPEGKGTLLGEGGAVLILEEREAARRRGARAYAEVAGFGASHSPGRWSGMDGPPAAVGDGADEGVRDAIINALDDAAVGPGEIDAVVVGGLGVPWVDAGEAGALREVFGDRVGEIELVTTKPAIGDSMAGEGALLAAVGAACVREQRLPARLHAGRPAEGLRAGRAESRAAALRHVLMCTPSLFGQVGAVVLRRVEGG